MKKITLKTLKDHIRIARNLNSNHFVTTFCNMQSGECTLGLNIPNGKYHSFATITDVVCDESWKCYLPLVEVYDKGVKHSLDGRYRIVYPFMYHKHKVFTQLFTIDSINCLKENSETEYSQSTRHSFGKRIKVESLPLDAREELYTILKEYVHTKNV